jgi:hypothetical protein
MPYKNSQINPQAVQPKKNDPDGPLPSLSDSDIDELIRAFQLLDEWDREAHRKRPVEEPTTLDHD